MRVRFVEARAGIELNGGDFDDEFHVRARREFDGLSDRVVLGAGS